MQYAGPANGGSCMTNQPVLVPTFSGPPVSSWFGFFSEFRRDSLGFLLRCHAYGDVVRIPMGRIAGLLLGEPDPAMYLLNHPSDVKHVLVSNQDNYTKAPVPPVESLVFGRGVLHTDGALHHHQRRMLLPFFHGDHVASYAGQITERAATLAAQWRKGTTIDVRREMTQLTLSVIWRLLFGSDVVSETEDVMRAITSGQHLIKMQYDSLLARMTPLWIPLKQHREFVRGHRYLDARIRRFIHDRRMTSERPHDLLSLLLAAVDQEGHPLRDEEIRDQLTTILLAGHETTANALTWAWFLLSQWPKVRAEMAHELATVVGDRLPNAADIAHLRYTKMIWDETLRLYPPAWLLHTRVSRSEDRLPSGALLHQGSRIFLSPWSLHRNPRWFPEPNRFDPDRFSVEANRQRLAFSYVPFGAGGRHCLGESFAELEGVLILTTLASKVRLRLVDGQTILPDPLMTLRPNVPVHMMVELVDSLEPRPSAV